MIICWPGRIETGRDFDGIANPIDLMPALATICNAELSSDCTIDGEDLSPWLLNPGEATDLPDRTILYQWHRGDVSERYHNFAAITQRWKLLCAKRGTGNGADAGAEKSEPGAGLELYDLKADPHEQHDLAHEHPHVVRRLRDAYECWFEDVCTTYGEGTFESPRIGVGTTHAHPAVLTRQDWRVHGQVDSFTTGPPGWRIVDIRSTGPYMVKVRLPSKHPAVALILRFDGVERVAAVRANQGCCTFEDLHSDVGPGAVEVFLHGNNEQIGASFIFVRTNEVPHTDTPNEL